MADENGSSMEKRNLAHLAKSNSMPKSLAKSLTLQYGTFNHRVQGRTWNWPSNEDVDVPNSKRLVAIKRSLADLQNEDLQYLDPSWALDPRF